MNVLLDCGSHFFEGLYKLDKIYHFGNDWRIVCFEANPETYEQSLNNKPNFKNLYINNIAISDKADFVIVNCDKDYGEGSNILEYPPVNDIVYGNTFNFNRREICSEDIVDSIDYENLTPHDKLFIKLDIEGSEYPVIHRLIESGYYKKIDTLYVEFHDRFFEAREYYQQLNRLYVDFLTKSGVKVVLWD